MAFSKRWDITVSSQIEGKENVHRHVKVGVAFLNDKGNLTIKLDPGLAISQPAGVYINGFVPREQGQYQGGGGGGYQPRAPQQPPAQPYPQPGQGGDNVPF